ncbi:MAG: hypothetical protein FWG85_04485 [Bacteroidetes bacterium]|nr:hypothetical protein [Bacteroidota bacterium]
MLCQDDTKTNLDISNLIYTFQLSVDSIFKENAEIIEQYDNIDSTMKISAELLAKEIINDISSGMDTATSTDSKYYIIMESFIKYLRLFDKKRQDQAFEYYLMMFPEDEKPTRESFDSIGMVQHILASMIIGQYLDSFFDEYYVKAMYDDIEKRLIDYKIEHKEIVDEWIQTATSGDPSMNVYILIPAIGTFEKDLSNAKNDSEFIGVIDRFYKRTIEMIEEDCSKKDNDSVAGQCEHTRIGRMEQFLEILQKVIEQMNRTNSNK